MVLNNKKFKKKIDFIFDKGTDRSLVISNKRKYYSWVEIGSSFLLPELNVSFLLPQINSLQKIISYRKKLYFRYLLNFKRWLSDQFKIVKHDNHKYNFHALVIILNKNNRVEFLNFLKKYGIYAFIGYVPLHKSPYGKKFASQKKKLKITDKLEKKIIRLPLHNHMSIKDVDFISSIIENFFKKIK